MTGERHMHCGTNCDEVPIAPCPLTRADGTIAGYLIQGQNLSANAPATAALTFNSPTITGLADETLDIALTRLALPELFAGHTLVVAATARMLHSTTENFVPAIPVSALNDTNIRTAIRWRSTNGLRTALLEYTGTPTQSEFLPLCTLVTVTAAQPDSQLQELISQAHAAGVTAVVTNAPTAVTATRAFDLDADLVEGMPLPPPACNLNDQDRHALQLLQLLDDEPVDLDAVVEAFAADSELAQTLLRAVNSVLLSLPQKVTSVRQAATLIRPRFAQVVVLSRLLPAGSKHGDQLWYALARGLTTWRISEDENGYLAGLLSAAADYRGLDPHTLAQHLNLTFEAHRGLCELSGLIGGALTSITAAEHGNWQSCNDRNLDPQTVSAVWFQTLREARPIASALTVPIQT